jgi:methyl-accepting chemotaxis protein
MCDSCSNTDAHSCLVYIELDVSFGAMEFWVFLCGLLVSALLAVLAVIMVVKSIRFTIRSFMAEINNAVEGDLTERIVVDDNDEMGMKLNSLADKFLGTMKRFAESSHLVSGTAFELEQGAKDYDDRC